MQLLTNSRMSAFKECRKKHEYAYELVLRPIDDAKALRMGSATHDGIDALSNGLGVPTACNRIYERYDVMPERMDCYWWEIERETILRLVCAYDWRWGTYPIENVAVEHSFSLPLVNPETRRPTPNFMLAGKIDGIVRLEDGRLAVKETKTVSDDVGPDSALWRRLRRDSQISIYTIAARRLGYPVEAVLYDLVRKPTISPTPVPLLDEDGLKIVLGATGERIRNTTGKKEWRQTGDAAKQWVLQTRPMTVEEWGTKLTDDITERPDYYFARTEVARLDDDLAETESEMWEIQLAIRQAQLNGHWYRTVNRNTCIYCCYDSICDRKLAEGEVPSGFTILSNPHPELGDTNGNGPPTGTTETAPAETACASAS